MKILFHAVNLLETALSHQKKKKKKLVGNGVVNGFARSSKKMVLLLLSMGENQRDREFSVTVIVGSISSYILSWANIPS